MAIHEESTKKRKKGWNDKERFEPEDKNLRGVIESSKEH